MQLIAKVKLLPSPEQAHALKRTLETANAACNYISEQAWQERIFRQFSLHKLVYYNVRERFGLSAQMAVRCISKVADAYKRDRKPHRSFRREGAIVYDSRIPRWKQDEQVVSIWTVNGRQAIFFACGERQRELLQCQRGESDLALIDGTFYLLATCEASAPEQIEVEEALGVDLGIVNIATDSDGEVYSGAQINGLRTRHARLRAKLQHKGTKSAKRLLKKRKRRERRFALLPRESLKRQKAPFAPSDWKTCRASVIGQRLESATGDNITLGPSTTCSRRSSTKRPWPVCP